MDTEYNYPSRRPLFSLSGIIITTIPIIAMITGSLRLLILGGVNEAFVSVGWEILMHLLFCALGAPFACLIGILASYIGRERNESLRMCKITRVYSKAVLFSCLAFLAVLAVIAFLK